MMRVRCPDCDARLEVDDEDLGRDIRCPSCRAVFPAQAEGAPPPADEPPPRRREWDDRDDFDRPRRRRYRPVGSYDDDPGEIIDDARRTVHLPALLSILACVVTIVYHAADTAFILMNPQALKNNPFNFGGAQPPPNEVIIGAKGFIFLYEVVVLAGSIAMMRMKSYKFAIAAMVMQIIPCAGVCCFPGLCVGIWGLVTLNRPDVKLGYELAEREQARDERRRDDGADDL